MIGFWHLIFFLFVIIPIHELGHYLMFRAFGYKPSFRFVWGMILIGENVMYQLKVMEIMNVILMGIFLGYIPILLFISLADLNTMILVYLAMCIMDIASFFSLITIKDWKITLLQHLKNIIAEEEAKEKATM